MLLGYIIGVERQTNAKVLGGRSIALVTYGAYLFTYIAYSLGYDVARMITQIVMATGFISSGIIFKCDSKEIKNLTTAITVWVCTTIGIFIGMSLYIEAIVVTILLLLILEYKEQ